MWGFEVLIGRLLNDRFVLNMEKENKFMVKDAVSKYFNNLSRIIGSLCTVDDGATYRSNGVIRKNFTAISIYFSCSLFVGSER